MPTGQRTFDDMGAPLHTVPFCVLDLETTGTSAADCEITEIGAVKFVGGEPAGTFQTLVNPGVGIPPFVTMLTGITEAMVVKAPPIGEALPSLLEFIGDSVIVGHNVRFDMSFLNAAAERLGYGKIPNRTVDTLALGRRLVRSEVRNLKLSTLAAHFRAPAPPTHRALDDAVATAHVFWSLVERAGTLGVTHLDDLLVLPTARGAAHYEKISLTDDLPRAPGVYSFLDADGTVIYVGKATNLRTRVRSYFHGDRRRSVAAMLRDLAEIEHLTCPTVIEAEITELRLIAEHRPRYNRKSRPPRSRHWVKLTDERYPRLSIVRTIGTGGPYLGPFRSRRAAEVVVHAVWDASKIRRCTGSGRKRTAACSFAQLGVAACPCEEGFDETAYREIVEQVREGFSTNPQVLLEGLVRRMNTLSDARRYEDAAVVRDRLAALERAVAERRAWQALVRAGTVWVADAGGAGVVIRHGSLVASWGPGATLPLVAAEPPPDPVPEVPPSVAAAQSARLLWKWIERDGTRVIRSTGPAELPCRLPQRATFAGCASSSVPAAIPSPAPTPPSSPRWDSPAAESSPSATPTVWSRRGKCPVRTP